MRGYSFFLLTFVLASGMAVDAGHVLGHTPHRRLKTVRSPVDSRLGLLSEDTLNARRHVLQEDAEEEEEPLGEGGEESEGGSEEKVEKEIEIDVSQNAGQGTAKSKDYVRGASDPSNVGFRRNGRPKVEHGKWMQSKTNPNQWFFVSRADCQDNVCPGTVADDNLRQMMDLPAESSDKEVYDTFLNARKWNKHSDSGMRDLACKGHRHQQEFWCKGQAGLTGQMSVDLDNLEDDWRQKAVTRQKAKFAMLEYAKQRITHEEEHQKAIAAIKAAKELLEQKRRALEEEERKVKVMETQAKEALKQSGAQQTAAEEALKQTEMEEMIAWQQMQAKRQLVVKFRALNKNDITEMIKQQREEERIRERDAKHT